MYSFFKFSVISIVLSGLSCKGQSFYNPQIYEVNKANNPLHFRVIKVSNDSAYLHFLNSGMIKLKNLASGEDLAELELATFYTDRRALYDQKILVTDNQIEILTIHKTHYKLELSKQHLSSSLNIQETGQKIAVSFPRDFKWSSARIIPHENFYELLFTNGCPQYGRYKEHYYKYDNHYFMLLTLDKNLHTIDSYIYDGQKEKYVAYIGPEENYSNAIQHQLIINSNDTSKVNQILISANKNGKIRKVSTYKLNHHINFIEISESKEKSTGYCIKLISPKKNEWTASVDKYETDYAAGTIKLVAQDIVVKKFPFKGLTSFCAKSFPQNEGLKILMYPINDNIGSSAGITGGMFSPSNSYLNYYALVSHAGYYDIRHDTVAFSYKLPFNFGVGKNPWGSTDIYMHGSRDNVYIGYNDIPENIEVKTDKDYEKIERINSDKINYGPVFYRVFGGAAVNKNSLKNPADLEYFRGILDPNLGYISKNGVQYLPFWSRSTGKLYIVKIESD